MTDNELKDIGGRQLTAEEMASEADRQRIANEAMEDINLIRETLRNVTVGNAEERKRAAIDAGKRDRAATVLPETSVTKKQ